MFFKMRSMLRQARETARDRSWDRERREPEMSRLLTTDFAEAKFATDLRCYSQSCAQPVGCWMASVFKSVSGLRYELSQLPSHSLPLAPCSALGTLVLNLRGLVCYITLKQSRNETFCRRNISDFEAIIPYNFSFGV